MTASADTATRGRILLLSSPSEDRPDREAALRDQGFLLTSSSLEGEVGWPDGAFNAAVVLAKSMTPALAAVAQQLKAQRPRVPLILWAPLAPGHLIEALNAGFDLWVPAEAAAAAVAAQVLALQRLTEAHLSVEPETVTVRGITVDFHRHEVLIGDRLLPLTPTEYRIVSFLARQPGRVVSHAQLFREVHGYDASEQEAKDILKVHISRLRNKLANAGLADDIIVTVRGFGYLLERRTRDPRREDGGDEDGA